MDNRKILQGTFEKIDRYINSNSDNQSPVVKFKMPAELSEIIDPAVTEEGVSEKGFLSLIDKYLDYSVRTGNKQFLNQLYSGFNFRHL
jgi:hypothetical protein